jgi:hypothetical protein
MILRSELKPNINLAEKLFPQLLELITLYDDDNIEEIISNINTISGKMIEAEYLLEYWGSESIEEFVFKLALPVPIRVENITYEELLQIISYVQCPDKDFVLQTLVDYNLDISYLLAEGFYLPLLHKNFSHPGISDLFYNYQIDGEFIELTPHEIAEEILNYNPILL